jgi:hypothetical protein
VNKIMSSQIEFKICEHEVVEERNDGKFFCHFCGRVEDNFIDFQIVRIGMTLRGD